MRNDRRLGEVEELTAYQLKALHLAINMCPDEFLAMADLGVRLCDLCEVTVSMGTDISDAMKVLPDFVEHIGDGRRLGLALVRNAALILEHPDFIKMIWLSHEPLRLVNVLSEVTDMEFVRDHIYSPALCTYLEYEGSKHGPRYKLYEYVSQRYNRPIEVLEMAYRARRRGTEWKDVYAVFFDNKDLKNVYRDYLEYLYEGSIGTASLDELVLLEALFDRGYRLYEVRGTVRNVCTDTTPMTVGAPLALLYEANIEVYLQMGATMEILNDLGRGNLPDYFLGEVVI